MSSRDGLLLVDKESGVTSHDVVDLVRRFAKTKKVGHTGTLDPLATGLLILCVGKATRLQSFLMNMEKTYEGLFQFGWATDTYDAVGNAIGDPVEKDVSHVDWSAVTPKFTGEIEQMPPQFSAKKVDGVRAYELARRGEESKLQPKRVKIPEFAITSVDSSRVGFRIRCSAGTYVRSVAYDVGQVIGVPAHLKSLRRTSIGSFVVDGALPSQKIRGMSPDEILAEPHYRPMSRVDLRLAEVVVDPMQERKIISGQSVIVKPSVTSIRKADLVSIVNLDNELVAIGEAADVLREEGGPILVQPKVVLKAS